MTLRTRKLRNLAVLLGVVSLFPTYERLDRTLVPARTMAPHQADWEIEDGRMVTPDGGVKGSYFYRGNKGDIYLGLNETGWEDTSQLTWHRIRLGFPVMSPFTFDYDPVNDELRGRIEVGTAILNVLVWLLLWASFQGGWMVYSRLKGSDRA